MRTLLEKGVNINVKNTQGIPLLHILLKTSDLDIALENVKRFLDLGADPNLKGIERDTALHLAVRTDSLRMVQMLLAKGGDPNAENNSGNTPLLEAMLRSTDRDSNTSVVEALIAVGANVNLRNDAAKTPLMLAKLLGHQPLIDLVEDALSCCKVVHDARHDATEDIVEEMQRLHRISFDVTGNNHTAIGNGSEFNAFNDSLSSFGTPHKNETLFLIHYFLSYLFPRFNKSCVASVEATFSTYGLLDAQTKEMYIALQRGKQKGWG
ncbi:MAG: ankyrin repeat domain-containing protein [Amoebophilaceae bacterium]|nr:ankyrin repeat domain-containing protein [Amoebophilaceae bacterium]